MEDARMEDAGMYLVPGSHCITSLSTGSASDQHEAKHLYAVNDIFNKLFHCTLHGFTL